MALTSPASLARPCLPLLVLLSISLIVLTGCRHGGYAGPKLPDVMTAPTLDPTQQGFTYTAAQYSADKKAYDAAMKESPMQTDKARVYRDTMVAGIEAEIEHNYQDYKLRLSSQRAFALTVADMVELGTSASITVVGSSATKELLGAALTAFKGSRISVDKNYFQEKTTTALTSSMDARRDRIRDRIAHKLTLSVTAYTFEEARRDLFELFYAGTLPSALEELASTASASASDARANFESIDKAKRLYVPDTATFQQHKLIRAKFDELQQLAGQPEKNADAVSQLQKILDAMQVPDAMTITDSGKLLDLLADEMRLAYSDPEKAAKLMEAMRPK